MALQGPVQKTFYGRNCCRIIIVKCFCYEIGRGNILKAKPKSPNTILISHPYIANNNKKFVRHFVNVISGLVFTQQL
jgi:hypothetical protein